MIRKQAELLRRIRAIHEVIRDDVITSCERTGLDQLAAVVAEEAGDTIFAIDRVSEAVLLERFTELAREWSFVLVAEGLGSSGRMVLPEGLAEEQAELWIIVDPIDGTRGLMYQKRPAWILTGVAPNRGPQTSLADIELAIQTEIPLLKQHLADCLWAILGQGAHAERWNRLSGETRPLALHPSGARTISQGFGGLARFFPGARAELAAIDDALIERVLGKPRPGLALSFEDQYICSGGQLYELMVGHDRWVADLRPLMAPLLLRQGYPAPLCCHPYDLCSELIAREAGVSVVDEHGRQLAAPLDVTSDVCWIGWANDLLAAQIGPVLRAILVERGLLREGAPRDLL